MSDEQQSQLKLSYGDRLATIAFCKSLQKADSSDSDTQSNLLARIKKKLSPSDGIRLGRKKGWQMLGNKNAKKIERRLELGWKTDCGTDGTFILHRSKGGGGTRHIKLEISTALPEIQKQALEIFFPTGKSVKGKIDEFEHKLTLFDGSEVSPEETIQSLYVKTKVKILRLYLCSTKIDKSSPKTENDSVKEQPISTDTSDSSELESFLFPEESIPCKKICIQFAQSTCKETEPSTCKDTENNVDLNACRTPETTTENILMKAIEESKILESNTFVDDLMLTADQDINFENKDMEIHAHEPLDDTLDMAFIELKLHRGNVMKEMIKFFEESPAFNHRCSTIHVKMILPDGKEELAEDSGGVLRDALSEFWTSFEKACMSGDAMKVPAISPNMNDKQWAAVARIIVCGYYYQDYLPLHVSPVFMQYACQGDQTPKDILIGQYLQFLAENERKTLKSALHTFNETDEDDLIDLLSDHEVGKLPTKENIHEIAHSMAHTELIQSPSFVAEVWRPILRKDLVPILKKPIGQLLEDMIPTFKAVWGSLSFEDGYDGVKKHLKKYLKDSTTDTLCLFLRFVTGTSYSSFSCYYSTPHIWG
jgi:hypothetical protein